MARQPKTATPKTKFGTTCPCGSGNPPRAARLSGILRWICDQCAPAYSSG